MSKNKNLDKEEEIKRFLIIGETLDDSFSYTEFNRLYLTSAIILIIAGILSFVGGIIISPIWYFLAIGFLLVGIYFSLLIRKNITYAITKYRVIRLENDLLSRLFFRKSRLIQFTDLHYEHVESIDIRSKDILIPRFYISLFLLSFGIIFLDLNVLQDSNIIINLISVISIVIGFINILYSLPLGGVQLVIQSISGQTMKIPESTLPHDFVDDLILNCRNFLTYGAK